MSTPANHYWKNALIAMTTVCKGLLLTAGHLLRARKSKTNSDITSKNYFEGQQGITTIQFPHETIPVPDTGRYQLHNEIDDCIVCDKCAKICPVNCITIEPIRSHEEFGKTSDGTSRRIYAAKFDIDMGKCCFCGLCTTVCPTECLTMTKTYNFSVVDIRQHNFEFANMTQDNIIEKQRIWNDHQATKAWPAIKSTEDIKPASVNPVFKPKINPRDKPPET